MIRSLLVGGSFVAALVVAVGFLGQLHRSFDTIAMLRPVFGALCIIGVFAARPVWQRLLFSATAAIALLNVASFFMPQDPGSDLSVYSKNLWFNNSEIPAVVADIESTGVDAVMLQEVSYWNREILDQLKPTFPYQHFCGFSHWSGIAIASRHPFVGQPICTKRRAMAAAPIQIKTEKVWLVSAHIPWPWPHDSASTEQEVERLVSELDGAVVIAGDFNIMPWSGRVGRIASITNTQLAGPARSTFRLRSIPLPLDVAMAPGGGSLETRPFLGADHAGILAKLSLTAP